MLPSQQWEQFLELFQHNPAGWVAWPSDSAEIWQHIDASLEHLLRILHTNQPDQMTLLLQFIEQVVTQTDTALEHAWFSWVALLIFKQTLTKRYII